MKKQFVKELAEGTKVDTVFLVSAKEMRSTRKGDAYLVMELSDRTGRLGAIFFRPSASSSNIPVGSVGHIRGVVTNYRGNKRISVESMSGTATYEADDLLATGPSDSKQLLEELRKIASGIRDKGLRSVLKAVFGDELFLERFTVCPGAQSHHHAYRGGLLEHTVSVARLCEMLSANYIGVDRDLLVAAALLHDVGKVDELAHSLSIEYTDRGRFIGHVVMGERRIREAVSRGGARVQDDQLDRLSHAVLSHHGELEWGSPKRPSTLEALLLHHADNLDAKAAGFQEIMSGAMALDERWTDAQNLFRRPLYAPALAQDERPRRAQEDDQFVLESA